ncbi:hypothetical protein ACHAW6_001604 [Cyclotella cf. meneghiniana]
MADQCNQQIVSNTEDVFGAKSLVPRIVSGSIGSIITTLAVTPLEVVKIRQQASLPEQNEPQRKYSMHKLNDRTLWKGRLTSYFPFLFGPGPKGKTHPVSRVKSPRVCESTLCTGYSSIHQTSITPVSTLHLLRSISKTEGISGLYSGLRPTLLMTVPNTALTLTLYDEITASLGPHSRWHTSFSESTVPLFAGALSRLVSSTATAPLELIRTRKASFHSNKGGRINRATPGLIEEFRSLLRTNGIVGLYTGLPVTLLRDVCFSALYFFCLEQLRAAFEQSVGKREDCLQKGTQLSLSATITHNFLSGAAAATVATVLTGPFDVIKTRTQTMHNGSVHTKHGLLVFMKSIYKHEGIAGLWRGNLTRMAKVVPASAIMISCYEIGKGVVKEMLE